MDTTPSKHLWLLTGRANDFVNHELNYGISYSETGSDPVINEARTLLHLHYRSSDYYVIAAMASLLAYRRDDSSIRSSIFLPYSLTVAPPEVIGGRAVPANNAAPCLLHRPSSIPAPRRWVISYLDAASIKVETDIGTSIIIPYRFSAGVLYPEWPQSLGFEVAFATDSETWGAGSEIVMTTEPSGYPFEFVGQQINQTASLVRLMANAGTLSHFLAAASPVLKVGAFCSAIVSTVEKSLK